VIRPYPLRYARLEFPVLTDSDMPPDEVRVVNAEGGVARIVNLGTEDAAD